MTYLKAVGVTLGVIAALLLLWLGVFAFRWATAGPSGKLSAREQIQSGSFRIAAYDSFFNLCASVQGLEGQLDAQRSQLADSSGDDRSRVEANIAGIEGARSQAIAEYNADARKSYTSGQFRSSDLPFQLDSSPYVGGEHTSCNA